MSCCGGDEKGILFYGRISPEVRGAVEAFLADHPEAPIAAAAAGHVIAVRASHNRYAKDVWEEELNLDPDLRAKVTIPELMLPPVEQKPLNFIQKVKSYVHVKTGGKVDPTIAAARLVHCNACDYLDRLNRRCELCGCLVDDKTRWTRSHCPHQPPKWAAEPEDVSAEDPAPIAGPQPAAVQRTQYTVERIRQDSK